MSVIAATLFGLIRNLRAFIGILVVSFLFLFFFAFFIMYLTGMGFFRIFLISGLPQNLTMHRNCQNMIQVSVCKLTVGERESYFQSLVTVFTFNCLYSFMRVWK